VADPSRTFIEVGAGMKDRLRHAVEALIDVLDSLDPDLEDDDDNGIGDLDGPVEQSGYGRVEQGRAVLPQPLPRRTLHLCPGNLSL
jgi:hypothetical protein